MTKIALFYINYGPYHLARFATFRQHCLKLAWNAKGIELTRSGIEYEWKTELAEYFDSIVSVLGEQEPQEISFILLLKKLFAVLSETNPDIIAIAGYADLSMLSAFLWSLWNRKPVILFSDTKENDAPRSWWREKIKSFILQKYNAALVGGKPHKRYLLKLGMSSESIFEGCNVVGNDNFHPDQIQSLPAPHHKPYFLAVNRFIPLKNLHNLISSYAAYRQLAGGIAWDLILCGDGEIRSQIERQISQLSLQDAVHLPGFLQQNELLPYFAHASCFVHPSFKETWGLVINEAMAAGLPILVSNRCGCFEDLVIEGVNGFGFDPENTSQLTNLMLKISSPECDREKMGKAALKHIQKFSPDYFAESLVKAVEYVKAYSNNF